MKFPEFRQSQTGSIGVVFAIGLVPLCLAAGVAIDYNRVLAARTAAQAALDSTLLAAAASRELENAGKLKSYFDENARKIDARFENLDVEKDPDGIIRASVDVSVPMSLLTLAGMTSVEFPVVSVGKGVEVKKLSEVTFRTESAKGIYDKDVYFVTRDAAGNILTRSLVLSYDWQGPGKEAVFTPSVKNEFRMDVGEYESWAVELVVFIDDSFNGDKIGEVRHFSDGPDAETWQKIDGECDDAIGQYQTWEDLGDSDYADFSFTLNCKKVTQTSGAVRLLK